MNKVIIKESKPVIYVSIYMVYAFMFGVGLMWFYINEMGGAMPEAGSLYIFIKKSYTWITSLGFLPIMIKILTKYLENKKNKELERTRRRRKSDV